ncbi:MAG: type III secretion system stator protein SctL [Alsobacter sp.]
MRAPVFVPSGRIVSAEDLGHLTEAAAFMGQARKLAEEARGLASSEHERAVQAGYAEGFRRGVREAMAQLGPAVTEARARLTGAEGDLAGIVLEAVQQIVGRLDDGELARRLVAKALADAVGLTGIVLRVAAEDLATIEREVAALHEAGQTGGLTAVRADPLLHPGEMILETPRGHVHVGLKQQLGRLQAGLGVAEARR